MSGRQLFSLFIALTLFVSVAARPPGTMLTLVGDTLTIELCAGDRVESIAVNLDTSDDRQIDISCDASTAPLATLPALSGSFGIAPASSTVLAHFPQTDNPNVTATWRPYTSRAPPLLS